MVTDAQVNAALTTWNSMSGTDRTVLRKILEDFETSQRAEAAEAPEIDPSELGSVVITLSVSQDGKLNIGTEAAGNLDYATIRMMLAMASESESVRLMTEELGQ